MAIDSPDIGTLGGTFTDGDGENSSTLGGALTQDQSYANEDVNSNPWGYDFNMAELMSPSQFSLSNLWGSYPSTGLPTSTGPYAGNTKSYGIEDFENSRLGKLATTVLGLTPYGRAFNVGRSVVNMLGQGKVLDAGVRLAGSYGGLPGAVINAGYNASQGRMGPAGSLAGGMAFGPAGAFVGSEIGNSFSGRPSGGAPNVGGRGESGGEFDVGSLAQGLGSLWAASQADKGLSGVQSGNNAIQAQLQSLGSMYGPNSPYAAQLRQTLERKDAAAGRRSQYGPREVQLMAALADKQAGVSDSMARLAQTGQANQIALNAQRNKTRGQQLALVGNLAKQSGLLDMFRGGGNSAAPAVSYQDQGAQYEVPDNYNWNQYNNTDSLYGG